MSSTSSSDHYYLFLSTFIASLGSLILGSRFLINKYDIFPGDGSDDPLTFANILHTAWGRAEDLSEEKLVIGGMKMDVTTVALAVFVGLSAVVAVFLLGREKKGKPVLDPTTWQEFKLVHKTAISHNTALYRFALPTANSILGLPIGQHIWVQAEINGKNVQRSYTPTSSDDNKGHFDLLVKSYEKGNISKYLSLLSLGQAIRVKGPKGQFNYVPGLSRHLGMIAGGTGITPMLQIIRAILKNPHDKTHISLIYANVTFDDILLKEELDRLVEEHSAKLTVYYVLNEAPADGWDGGVGFVTKEMIREHMPAPKEDIKLLLCGPPPMIEVMKRYSTELGYETPRTASKLVDQVFVF